ncbi:MAG TPA: hypothetical protein VLC52_16385, partial [Anaerolineae bacterium]|nr:hypothetical protein [Anaerolineae bacterium]
AVYLLVDRASPMAGATAEATAGPPTASLPVPTHGPTSQAAAAPPPTGPAPSLTAVATASPTPYAPIPGQKRGIHLLLDDGRNHWPPEVWPQHLQAARRIVGEGGYVVQLIRLDDLDVSRWQQFLDLCARERLVPIIRLAGEYDHDQKWWIAPPRDADGQGYQEVAARYRDFLARLRWPAEPRYAVVYNEPNRGDEWSNAPSPAEYARFLYDVGRALDGIGITVLGPALDLYAPHSNGQLIAGHRYVDAETFLDEMVAAQPRVFDVVDVWASHAYPLDPFRLDPSRQVFQIDYANGASNPRHLEPPDGLYNRGVNSYRWELWKLEQLIGPRARELPVMITESGWRHAPTQDPQARDSVHAEVSFETMAAHLDLAFYGNGGRYPELPETGWTPWQEDPRVLGVVLFALGGYPPDWGHTNWAVLDEGGQIIDLYPIPLAPARP